MRSSSDRETDLWLSPLRRRHREIAAQGVQRHIPREVHRRQLLFGPGRVTKFPLMALKSDQDLGDCRHALAQRAIAGSVEVHWVFPTRKLPAPAEHPSSDGPRLASGFPVG